MKYSKKLRKIVVNNIEYLWSTKHLHDGDTTHSQCIEILTIYREGYKRSPLKVYFNVEQSIALAGGPNEPHWVVGYPEKGVAWKTGAETKCVNLNRPGVIAVIIKHAISENWDAYSATQPMIVENGFDWLEKLDFPEETS